MISETDDRIAQEAEVFFETGKECYKKCIDGSKTQAAMVCIPAIVNLSFSIELFLKSILKGKGRGHHLDILFNKIEIDYRDMIIQLTIMQYREYTKNTISNEVFLEKLHDSENSFYQCRYYYEEGKKISVDVTFLLSLATAFSSVYRLFKKKSEEMLHRNVISMKEKTNE